MTAPGATSGREGAGRRPTGRAIAVAAVLALVVGLVALGLARVLDDPVGEGARDEAQPIVAGPVVGPGEELTGGPSNLPPLALVLDSQPPGEIAALPPEEQVQRLRALASSQEQPRRYVELGVALQSVHRHVPAPGAGPRGIDVGTDGTIWVALGGSGHLGKFERDKCEQTWGTGDQCPEGWTFYKAPGPEMDVGEGEVSADFHYYLWVDQFNTLGMGKNRPILNGTGSDSLLAFDQEKEKFVVIRTPYPINNFQRGLDGRIDSPKGGWKGRGLWYTNGSDPVLHSEIQQSYAAQVQLRPNPLAR